MTVPLCIDGQIREKKLHSHMSALDDQCRIYMATLGFSWQVPILEIPGGFRSALDPRWIMLHDRTWLLIHIVSLASHCFAFAHAILGEHFNFSLRARAGPATQVSVG